MSIETELFFDDGFPNAHCQYPHQFTEEVSIIFLPEELKSRTKVFLSISCIAHHSVHLKIGKHRLWKLLQPHIYAKLLPLTKHSIF